MMDNHVVSACVMSIKFPKSARLLTESEYKEVFDLSCKSSDSLLIVLALNNGRARARLGLAISRKCARRAVDRNRIKRVIREAFRLSRAKLPGLDFVVLCRAVATESSNSALGASLLAQLEKVRQRKCAES